MDNPESRPPHPDVADDYQTILAPCRKLRITDPFRWLRAGWRDYWTVPRIALGYGLFVFMVSTLLSWLGWLSGGWLLLLTLLTGFVFLAPLLAFALFSISRQIAMGVEPSLRRTLQDARRPFQNALLFGLVLLVVFLVWTRAGFMVQMFLPMDANPSWTEMATFLAAGIAVGAVFAAFTFAASAFSLPMLANRDVDAVTAVISSINAVMRNKLTAATWAALIVALTVIGILTAFLGLILVIPWLAFASWHGARQALDCSAWPLLDASGQGAEEA